MKHYLLFFMFWSVGLSAQSKVFLQAGWTHAQVRTHYDPNLNYGSIFSDFTVFRPLNAPFWGVSYAYDHRQWRFSTGLVRQTFGAANDPWFPTEPWRHAYIAIPLLVGHKIPLGRCGILVPKTGIDIGVMIPGPTVVHVGDTPNDGMDINWVVDVALHWKRLGIGVRGHWGLTNFEKHLMLFYYQHMGITTYISYNIWDHQKAKARRLQKKPMRQ